jgi:hypothetical protein
MYSELVQSCNVELGETAMEAEVLDSLTNKRMVPFT